MHKTVSAALVAVLLAGCTNDAGPADSGPTQPGTQAAGDTAGSPADSPTTDPGAGSSVLQITNPVVEQRADPSVYRHTDGYYYMTASVPTYDQIELRRSQTLQGLGEAEPVVVWKAKPSGPQSAWVWAPEIFFLAGAWYIYYSAGETTDPFATHRMYALTTDAADPTAGTWTEKGQIKTKWESFSLDQTTFEAGGRRYLVWAQQDPEIRNNSNLYIAEMDSPTSITGEQVMIGTPTFPWEGEGYVLNEAPQVLQRNGRIFLTYSASATDARYKMGLYTAADGADPLDPKSWKKSPDPVFQTSEANKVFGPGSNAFTVSDDGRDDILVYNARSYRDPKPDPLKDPNRSTRMQQLFYDENGDPYFGVPAAAGTVPTKLVAKGGQCLRPEPVGLVACSDPAAADLDFQHVRDGGYRIQAGSVCLAVGAQGDVTFTGCAQSATRSWRIRPANDGLFQVVSDAGGESKPCLTPGTDAALTLAPCKPAEQGVWSFG